MFVRIVLCTFFLIVGVGNEVFSESVEAGFGKIKLNGLLQFWYQNDNGATPYDTFRLRRAEIKLSGDIVPEVSWAVMFDPAQVREDDVKTSGTNVTLVGRKSLLQDFVITLKPHECFSVDFGQYKIPFGMEGLESSAKLDFVERSALTSQFKWSDYRDIGFTVKGNFDVQGIKVLPAIGVFNGEGQNKLDVNNPVDLVGRLVINPIKELQVGFAHYNGKLGTGETDNFRTGIELKTNIDPIIFYGEYAQGKASGKNKQTYYVTAGYKILDNLHVVARYDYYDNDTDTSNDEKHEDTIGLNYFIEKHNAKIQLNYIYRGEKGTQIDDNVIRLNVQVSY